METLLDDLLAYSKAGQAEQSLADVDCAAVVRSIVETAGFPETFRIVADASLPRFETARTPFEQIMRNLISNAVKHHDREEGSVLVRAEDRGDYYRFVVEDDGPGIEPRFRERIFLMFEKLASRDQVEGSGMGLALVKKLVERHGGRVAVDSPMCGRGAVFLVDWPKQMNGVRRRWPDGAGSADKDPSRRGRRDRRYEPREELSGDGCSERDHQCA